MKICFINNFYPPQVKGGAEKVIARMVEILKIEHSLTVITLASVDEAPSCRQEEGVTVYRLFGENIYHLWNSAQSSVFKKIIWHLKNLNNRSLIRRVKEIMAKEKPDLIITGNLMGLSMNLAMVLSQTGYVVAHYLFDYQLIDPYGTLFRRDRCLITLPWYLELYRALISFYFKKVKACLAPSQFIIKKHQDWGFFNNKLVRQLTSPIVDLPLSSKILVDVSLPLRLVYVGQIEPTKGIDFLLEALVAWPINNWQLTVIGDGSMLACLRLKYEQDQRINFVGKKLGSQLYELWQKHQLTVIPSRWWENFTTVALESYQLGLPVLGSSSGGTPELISVNQTGLIFKAGDKDDFLKNLEQIFYRPQQLAIWSAFLPEYLKQYQAASFCRQFASIVQEIKN